MDAELEKRAGERLLTGDAWNDLCEVLKQAGRSSTSSAMT